MSDGACDHGEWEVSVLGHDDSVKWHSRYPPPPPGTRLVFAEGELPEGVGTSGTRWVVVAVTWFVACSLGNECTEVTPMVLIAPLSDEEARG